MDFGGRIVKALSGFYYVRTPDGRIVECRARGKFRKEHLSPLVGDEVECSREGGRGMIERVLPRRNAFVRPAVSNLDALVIFASWRRSSGVYSSYSRKTQAPSVSSTSLHTLSKYLCFHCFSSFCS